MVVRILNGNAELLAAPLALGQKIVVRADKQAPLLAMTEVELDIELGHSAKVSEIEGTTIPKDWENASETIGFMKEGRVIVIGQTDIGKSTLCTYLANKLFREDESVALIDADIGQADIGPPATIGIARPQRYISSLGDLEPERLLFVGHTSPGHVERKLISGISKLLGESAESISIVNTDGWVLDPEAISYKVRLIESLNPDLVIGLSSDSELTAIMSASKAKCLILSGAKEALKRSQSNRRDLRTAGYRRYLYGGSVHTLPVGAVRLVVPNDLRTVELGPDGVRNALLGILNRDGYAIGIGVLLNVGPKVIQFYSRNISGVDGIEVGYVRVNPSGEELGFLDI